MTFKELYQRETDNRVPSEELNEQSLRLLKGENKVRRLNRKNVRRIALAASLVIVLGLAGTAGTVLLGGALKPASADAASEETFEITVEEEEAEAELYANEAYSYDYADEPVEEDSPLVGYSNSMAFRGEQLTDLSADLPLKVTFTVQREESSESPDLSEEILSQWLMEFLDSLLLTEYPEPDRIESPALILTLENNSAYAVYFSSSEPGMIYAEGEWSWMDPETEAYRQVYDACFADQD